MKGSIIEKGSSLFYFALEIAMQKSSCQQTKLSAKQVENGFRKAVAFCSNKSQKGSLKNKIDEHKSLLTIYDTL